jgi:SAM-dependent methyltransferase
MARTDALDERGQATLEIFRSNDACTEFLWERLSALSPRPVAGRVLEMGCGIGNLTRILLRCPDVEHLLALDMDPAYVARLRQELSSPRLDVTVARAEDFCPSEYASAERGFDFIVSSNVLEHIEDDARALSNCRCLLRPRGVVLLLVPAHPFLYSSLDKNLSHYRRYRRKDIEELARRASLRVLRLRHFNPVAALGWWLNGKILRRAILPERQVAFYGRFGIPLSKLADTLNPLPFGVSLTAALGRLEEPAPR